MAEPLFHTVRGDGPVCLVLCNLGTAVLERQLPAALDRRLRLVFVDLRGTGRSPGQIGELTFDTLAADLEALREQLGAPRVAVLGHSILGVLAIEYARRCPSTVSHAIAVGTPPFGDMARLMASGAAHFAAHASPERKQILQENLARLAPGTPPALAVLAQTPMRFFDPRFDAASLYAGAELRPGVLEHLLGRLAAGWDVTVDAAALRVPLLLALGRHDCVSPHVLWDGVAERLPAATVRLFERSGHQPFVEEPERFTEVVSEWMLSG